MNFKSNQIMTCMLTRSLIVTHRHTHSLTPSPGFWWNLTNLPLLSASDTVNTVHSGDKNDGDGDIRNVNAPLGSIQIWGKAGTILPLHAPLPINDENSSVSLTTTTARTLPYTLLVLLPSANATDATASATDFTVNGNAPARGLLFLDEENNDPNNNPSDDQSKSQAKNQANRLSQQHEKKKENSQKVQSGDLIIRFEANSTTLTVSQCAALAPKNLERSGEEGKERHKRNTITSTPSSTSISSESGSESESEAAGPLWGRVIIMGLNEAPTSLTLNGTVVEAFNFDADSNRLSVDLLAEDLTIPLAASWTMNWD